MPVDYTQPGVFVGTPKYIAPEQARGQPLDGSADVYQLGVVAFEFLAGRPPFIGADSVELVAKHITMQAPIPSDFNSVLPQAADDMCRQMLDKDPTKRPSVPAVRAMLEQVRKAPPSDRASVAAHQRAKQTEIITPVTPVPTDQVAAVETRPVPRKGGAPWWSFLVVGLGVLAIGTYFLGHFVDRDDAPPPPPQPEVTAPAPAPVVTPIPEAPKPPDPPPVADVKPDPAPAPQPDIQPDPPPAIDIDPPKPPPPPPAPPKANPPKSHPVVVHNTPSPSPRITPKDLPIAPSDPAPPPPPKPPKPPKPDDDGIRSPFEKK